MQCFAMLFTTLVLGYRSALAHFATTDPADLQQQWTPQILYRAASRSGGVQEYRRNVGEGMRSFALRIRAVLIRWHSWPSWTLLLACVTAVGGCEKAIGFAPAGLPVEKGVLAVHAVKLGHRDVSRRVVLPGTVRADFEVTIYAKVTGYLKEIPKDRGDKVKSGERIALLEIPEMISEIAHARASYEFEDATYKRLEAIRKVEKSAVTDQDLDLARAKRDMAQASLKKLETLQDYTDIRAPFAGTITERFADPGAFIQQGKIVSMVDTSKVRVLVDVPESDVRFATVGTETEIEFDALPGTKVRASISRIAESLDSVMRTMRIEIDVRNSTSAIYPGMFARVSFGVDRHLAALVVPTRAVTLQQDRAYVYINEGGVAKKVSVKLGNEDDPWWEVLSGLTGKELIILPEGKALSEGLAVRSEPEVTPPQPESSNPSKVLPFRVSEGDPK